jgi:mono/diheme cytochrome c family protein
MKTFNAEPAEPAEQVFSGCTALIVASMTTPSHAKRGKHKAQGISACSASSALIVVFVLLLALPGAACRRDMHDQPKYIPLRESTFFTDQRSARPFVTGTVARGQLREDALLYTGKLNGADATVFPFRIDARVMARGRERFDIYCAPCHGRTGQGDGMIVRRGYRRPPTFHQDRLRESPVGHFFDVITNGFGAMPDYAPQIKAEDRWAIVAYVRALQVSAHASLADVPADRRGSLDQPRPVER